eukprot:313352-Amphidinium_carterae.1
MIPRLPPSLDLSVVDSSAAQCLLTCDLRAILLSTLRRVTARPTLSAAVSQLCCRTVAAASITGSSWKMEGARAIRWRERRLDCRFSFS